jgi:hypothetical protein
MNKKLVALWASAGLLMAFTISSTVEQPKKVAATEVVAKWTPLFDGKTFAGWSKYGGGEVGKAWKIENGAMYLDAANKATWQKGDAGDIVTAEEYENFLPKWEA